MTLDAPVGCCYTSSRKVRHVDLKGVAWRPIGKFEEGMSAWESPAGRQSRGWGKNCFPHQANTRLPRKTAAVRLASEITTRLRTTSSEDSTKRTKLCERSNNPDAIKDI